MKVSLNTLPDQYKTLVNELDAEDQKLLTKHLPNYDTAREFSNLLELGIDLAARRAEIVAAKKTAYGKQFLATFSTILGISETTLGFVERSVRIFGGDYLRKVAKEAEDNGIKLTYTHIRELNLLEGEEYEDERQTIVDRILAGNLVTSRQIKSAVTKVLGTEDAAEDKAFAQADKKASLSGDALQEIASSKDIIKLCAVLVETIQQIEGKIDKIGGGIRTWRENVAFETLEGMCLDSLDMASSAINDFVFSLKDIGILLDDTIRVAATVNADV